MAIVLTPDVLKGQAGQMQSLMSQYDSLFHGVTGTLNQVNSNWSANLSHNFSSKISSAQRSFSGILDTLQFGVNAANTSANSFLDVDSQLAKMLGGTTGDAGSGYGAGSAGGVGKSESSKSSRKKHTLGDKVYGAAKKAYHTVTSKLKKSYDEQGYAYETAMEMKIGWKMMYSLFKAGYSLPAAFTPTGALSVANSLNDFGSSVSDLTYLLMGEWSNDPVVKKTNYDLIGTTNWLQDELKSAYGEYGGTVVYDSMSLVSFLDNADKMMHNFGILNTQVYGYTGYSPVWGMTHWEDALNNQNYFKLCGNIIKYAYKTGKSTWKIADTIIPDLFSLK